MKNRFGHNVRLRVKMVVFSLLTIFVLTALSCDPSADERCGDDYVLNVDHCEPKEEEPTDTNPVFDAGQNDAGTDVPIGMGTICKTASDCEAFEAFFCALNPIAGEGICTISNCFNGPTDICPGGWKCCKLPPEVPFPSFCLPEMAWDDVNEDMGCEG